MERAAQAIVRGGLGGRVEMISESAVVVVGVV